MRGRDHAGEAAFRPRGDRAEREASANAERAMSLDLGTRAGTQPVVSPAVASPAVQRVAEGPTAEEEPDESATAQTYVQPANVQRAGDEYEEESGE